jgi:hypothetical protein
MSELFQTKGNERQGRLHLVPYEGTAVFVRNLNHSWTRMNTDDWWPFWKTRVADRLANSGDAC